MTVAYSSDAGTEIQMAFAFCAPTDHFVKAKGRELATERLADPARTFRSVFDPSFGTIEQQVVGDVYGLLLMGNWSHPMPSFIPNWATRIAQIQKIVALDGEVLYHVDKPGTLILDRRDVAQIMAEVG